MKTAVVGLGVIGGTIATRLARGGVEVVVTERNFGKAQAFASELGGRASALTLGEAIGTADVVIFAVWFDVIKQLAVDHHRALSGKIVVDPSNPIAPDGKGGFVKTIAAEQSSGQIIAALLPSDAKLVKAFGSLGGASLATAAAKTPPQKAVLFYATDHEKAGFVVSELIEAAGFEPILIGGIAQSIRIEVFGDLHEFGKLGKVVSGSEARALLDA